jgi:tRNA-specific adenosine deaminase 1
MTRTLADTIAKASIDLYDTLRPHGKPAKRPNGVEEWTVLATISLVLPDNFTVTPVSLGTGVKVLPANRLPPLGDAVHDCHAEVLARRGFVRWLLEEARSVIGGESESGSHDQGGAMLWFDETEGKFRLKQGVEIWLYVSTLPVCIAHTRYHLLSGVTTWIQLTIVWGCFHVTHCCLARPRSGIHQSQHASRLA